MSTSTQEKPIKTLLTIEDDNLLSRVLAYKNEDVVARIMKSKNCDKARAEAIFQDTLRFLYICGTADGQWGPTQTIDAGWHEFIMFTRDYTDFCQEHFGRYIHHVPNHIDSKPDHGRPHRTLIAAIQVFGKENLSENWAYRNPEGKIVLGADLTVEEIRTIEASAPCDSCGCSAACNDD